MGAPSRPEIRELETFVAVAEHLSFSKAARSLHLSQPPLTRHVQALEARVGTRLLERSTHGVSLTPAGRLFLEDARSVLRTMDRATEALRRVGSGMPTRLRLAFVGALLDEALVEVLQRFQESHPACQLELADLPPAEQLEALRTGEIDGGFIGAQPSQGLKDLHSKVWRREALMLAIPAQHPLAKLEKLTWKSLEGQPWVLVSSEAASAFRRQFAELCSRAGLRPPRIVQETSRVTAILTMVAVGAGITLLPEGACHLLSCGVVYRHLQRPAPVLEHSFAWPAGSPSPAIKDFLTLLSRHAQDLLPSSRSLR